MLPAIPGTTSPAPLAATGGGLLRRLHGERTRRGFLPLVPAVCAAGIVAWAAITLAGPEAVSLGRAFLAGRASFLFRYMCSNKRGECILHPSNYCNGVVLIPRVSFGARVN
jgi:hypothetical protein